MNSLIAVRSVRAVLSSGRLTWKSSYATQSNVCNQQKSSSGSSNSTTTKLKEDYDPPNTIFKKVDTDVIGPGAGKETNYKNPEYFCYHEMSYAEMEIVMSKLRLPQPSSIKK